MAIFELWRTVIITASLMIMIDTSLVSYPMSKQVHNAIIIFFDTAIGDNSDYQEQTQNTVDNNSKKEIFVSAKTLSFVSFGLGIFVMIFLINCIFCIFNCITLKKAKYSKRGYSNFLTDADIEE